MKGLPVFFRRQRAPLNLDGHKPRVLVLIDTWNWAFHTIARAIQQHLSDEFDISILSVSDKPIIDDTAYDIIHVLFETEKYHRQFLRGNARIIKSVYSHYWQLEGLSAKSFFKKSLREADALTVPSTLLFNALADVPVPLHIFREGVDNELFHERTDVIRTNAAGWAGKDIPIKRLAWIKEATDGICELKTAVGNEYPYQEMPAFFSSVSTVICASIAEGCPRPLLEGMACGAFPISFDVGIAHEVIENGFNGLLVEEQSPQALRAALEWCMNHPNEVERARAFNMEFIRRTRSWETTTKQLAVVYRKVLDS